MEICNLAEEVRKAHVHTLGIIRQAELGDVIVALAACRYLKKALPHLQKVILFSASHFHSVLRCQNEVEIADPRPICRHGMLIVDFNMYFEQDHKIGAAHVPRLDRVLRTFGFSPPYR